VLLFNEYLLLLLLLISLSTQSGNLWIHLRRIVVGVLRIISATYIQVCVPHISLPVCCYILNSLLLEDFQQGFTNTGKLSNKEILFSPVLSYHLPMLLFLCYIFFASVLKFRHQMHLIFLLIKYFRIYNSIFCRSSLTCCIMSFFSSVLPLLRK
jgi:hypothetical protein